MSQNHGTTRATCERKRPYRSKREAKEAIAEVQARKGGGALNAYRCEHCARWHIGHRP